MKLTFLGTGSAFTVGENNYQSNMLLESDTKRYLLIDCGSDARLSCYEQGFGYQDIDAVYISHLHADHAGGLEWLGFSTYFDSACKKPALFCSDQIVDPLWTNTLSGGLNSLADGKATLSTFFTVHAIGKKNTFTWEGITFSLVKTQHTKCPSYGLHFETTFITGDTKFTPELVKIYKQSEHIFQDCETKPTPTGAHARYDELTALPAEIKKKMWLYHYNPGMLPDAVQGGFSGFAKKGQCFEVTRSVRL